MKCKTQELQGGMSPNQEQIEYPNNKCRVVLVPLFE